MDAILNSQVTNKGLYNEKEETDMGEMSLSDVAAFANIKIDVDKIC